MQTDRLFEILYILLNKSKTTAGELAAKLEVSERTIYRDIEALCRTGIPISTMQGKGGGISVMPGFVLNKSLLSQQEQGEILSALQSLQATKYPDSDALLVKLSSFFGESPRDWMEVDFADWSGSQKDKFALIKEGILHRRVLCFDYFSSAGEKTRRTIEPLQLWFKEKTWYLRAYCRGKQALRIFKLSRMRNLDLLTDFFEREMPKDAADEPDSANVLPLISVTLRLDASLTYRVFDEFEENEIAKNGDGSFTVTVRYPEGDWVYGYILSFGASAQVLSPESVRSRLQLETMKLAEMYR